MGSNLVTLSEECRLPGCRYTSKTDAMPLKFVPSDDDDDTYKLANLYPGGQSMLDS